MRKRSLILIGLVAVVVLAIAFLPARLVIQPLLNNLAQSEPEVKIKVEQVGGTIWDGFALIKMPAELNFLPVSLTWNVKGWRLLTGQLALALGLDSRDFRVSGAGFWGLSGKGVSDLNGDLNAAMLDRLFGPQGVRARGTLTADNIYVGFADSRVKGAGGQLVWSGGQVRLPPDAGSQEVELPGIKAVLSEVSGDLLVPFTESASGQELGEFALLMEQGLYSITVLQRVMTLAGLESDGNDNKILMKQQQPLSFEF